MSKIESRIGIIPAPDVKVFNLLSDFTNFTDLIPSEKVYNWKAAPDSCSFKLDIIGEAGLRILEKTPNNLIKISTDTETPVTFLLWINIESKSIDSCEVKITIEPQVNTLLLGMIKAPLQGFVDLLIEKLENLKF